MDFLKSRFFYPDFFNCTKSKTDFVIYTGKEAKNIAESFSKNGQSRHQSPEAADRSARVPALPTHPGRNCHCRRNVKFQPKNAMLLS